MSHQLRTGRAARPVPEPAEGEHRHIGVIPRAEPSRPGGAREPLQWTGAARALRWITDSLAVVGDDPHGAIAALVSRLPAEPGLVTVVGEPSGGPTWDLVAELVPIAVPPGAVARVAVSGAGGPGRDGSGEPGPAPAQILARQLDADVEAPVGRLVLVPGGTMFAPRGWRRFDRHGNGTPLGRRIPAPAWESQVDLMARPVDAGLRVVPIPAGLWVYVDGPGGPADDLPLSIPVDPERPVLLIGRPGSAPPEPAQLASMIDALYPDVLITPFGSGTEVCLPLAEDAARRWGRAIEVATGMPALDGSGRLVSLAVDPDGITGWQPLYARLRCLPGGPARPVDPVECLEGIPRSGPFTYRLSARWVVEAVPFGLWVRPPFAGSLAGQVRTWRSDPYRFTVVVGLPGTQPGDDVLPLLHALLARLPARLKGRLEVVPHEVRLALDVGAASQPGSPDVAIAPERAGSPRWWRPDPRFFAVLLEVDPRTGMILSDSGPVDPGDAGEIIAGQVGRADRPVLAVANAPIAPAVQQGMADQVQAIVISRDRAGWRVCRPRRAGIAAAPPVRQDAAFPFTDADVEMMLSMPAERAAAVTGVSRDDPLDLRETLDAAVSPGACTVAVTAGPGPDAPFLLQGRPATVWELATEIGRRRPGWLRRSRPVRLEVTTVVGPVLHLLANYLGSPVGVRMDRLTADAVGAEDHGWLVVTARRPRPAQEARWPGRLDDSVRLEEGATS